MRVRGQVTAFILVSFLLHLTQITLVFVFGSAIARLQRLEVDVAETKASLFRLNDLIGSVMITPGDPVERMAVELAVARVEFDTRLEVIDRRIPRLASASGFDQSVDVVRRLWARSEPSVLEIEQLLNELARNDFESRRGLDVSLVDYNSRLRTNDIRRNTDHYLIIRARNLIDSLILEADTYGLILVEAAELVAGEAGRTIRILTLVAVLSVIGFGAGVLVFGLRFSRESMVRRIDSLIDDVKVTERDRRTFQMRALRHQMNPHFLFNTLNTVRYTCLSEGASESAEMLRILSRLLRNRISSDEGLVTIRSEISNLTDYMTLMQRRYGSGLRFRVSCPDRIMDWCIPPFLIQPLLENAILHGLGERINSSGNAEVTLEFRPHATKLEVKARDNGAGMNRDQVSRILSISPDRDSDHIGVKNIHDRLVLAFGHPFGLSVQSRPDEGTEVTLSVPIHQQAGGDL